MAPPPRRSDGSPRRPAYASSPLLSHHHLCQVTDGTVHIFVCRWIQEVMSREQIKEMAEREKRRAEKRAEAAAQDD